MKYFSIRAFSLVVAMLVGITVIQHSTAIESIKTPPPEVKSERGGYVPPSTGAPARRVGGGTRGGGDGDTILRVLVPEDTGLSSLAQPVVYWYVNRPVPAKIELTLLDEQSIEPLLELTLGKPVASGFQALDLGTHGVTLKEGVEYQWSVALILNSNQRSQDVVASGTIAYVPPSDSLRRRSASADPREQPRIYAQAGYWYDAIAYLNRLIEENAEDTELRDFRRELLNQVGLPEVTDDRVAKP